MTKYFFQTRLPSFTHQLYMYGFQKVDGRRSSNREYYHELFLRDRFDLCKYIPRYDKGNEANILKSPSTSQVPNFYALPRILDSKHLEVEHGTIGEDILPPTNAASKPIIVRYKVVSDSKARFK